MTIRVLFVCLGNICRSPTAEGILRGLMGDANVEVDSAGTSNWHVGGPPDTRAQATALQRGYDLSGLRARQVTAQDFHDFDLILAMDRENLADLAALRPPNARARLELFLDYAPGQPLRDVPDPYYSHGFDSVFELLEEASRGLLADLGK